MDFMDVYGIFHPKASEYTFFSGAQGTFPRIDHILECKTNLDNFERIEIISSIFSDHDAMRLEINYKKKAAKKTDTWRLNNII